MQKTNTAITEKKGTDITERVTIKARPGWNFFPFLLGNITLAVLVTPIFNSGRGSLLWPMVFHWQLILPIWPDAQPYDTWLLLVVAVAVVWWNRETMLSRTGATTEVIPGNGREGQ